MSRPGVRHTADVDGTGAAPFVIAATGTEVRPR